MYFSRGKTSTSNLYIGLLESNTHVHHFRIWHWLCKWQSKFYIFLNLLFINVYSETPIKELLSFSTVCLQELLRTGKEHQPFFTISDRNLLLLIKILLSFKNWLFSTHWEIKNVLSFPQQKFEGFYGGITMI